MTIEQIEAARAIAADAGLDERNDYTGRGMFGRPAAWAAEGDVHPGGPTGRRLLATGCAYDQMGLDWVYYAADSDSR